MQKTIQSVPLLVIAVGVGIIVYHVVEDRKAKKVPEPVATVAEKMPASQLPVSDELTEADQQIVSRAFEAPEELDTAESPTLTLRSEPFSVKEKPTGRLSEISTPVSLAEAKPADTTPMYFVDDFSSLRTDAVKNPDSAQNRATVTTLMQKRQTRLARDGREPLILIHSE